MKPKCIYKPAFPFLKIGCLGIVFLIQIIFTYSFAQPNRNFGIKGFHIDLRTEVMTIGALKATATELAHFGINTIVMEWEATYPYQNHGTLSNAKAYSREEVREFIRHCDSLGIEVIPLQQCFGHIEYILRHDRYARLREDNKEISQVCPLKTSATPKLFTELFRDLSSMHNSGYIHIGGDETYLLGHCPACKEKVQKEGISKLYTDYIRSMYDIVISLGKKPVIWADMILKHPEALNELPKEVVLVDWNYGWERNYFGNIDNIIKSKYTIWGAPSIRSHPDDWYLTCWEKHFNNLKDFIPFAREEGYSGMIMTSWSTSGLYGFTWDISWEVIDMQPIRNVYPMSGSNILIAAYAEALNSFSPINPREFVIHYAQNKFGLNFNDAQKLWKILIANPVEIRHGQPRNGGSLIELRDSIQRTRELFATIVPDKNQKELDHIKLMVDMRLYYLNLKVIEAQYNAEDFSREEIPWLLAQTAALVQIAHELDIQFTRLNKNYLKDIEITEQNNIRNQRLNALYERLKQQI